MKKYVNYFLESVGTWQMEDMDCDNNRDDEDDMPSYNKMDQDYHPDDGKDHMECVDLDGQMRQPQHGSKYIVFRSMLLCCCLAITCGSRI